VIRLCRVFVGAAPSGRTRSICPLSAKLTLLKVAVILRFLGDRPDLGASGRQG
jgi:hypothetical protein